MKEEGELEIPKEAKKKEEEVPTENVPPTMNSPHVQIPFLDRLKISKEKDNFYNSVNILKQTHIELPFLDIIYIPKCDKFLKDIIGNKKKIRYE